MTKPMTEERFHEIETLFCKRIGTRLVSEAQEELLAEIRRLRSLVSGPAGETKCQHFAASEGGLSAEPTERELSVANALIEDMPSTPCVCDGYDTTAEYIAEADGATRAQKACAAVALAKHRLECTAPLLARIAELEASCKKAWERQEANEARVRELEQQLHTANEATRIVGSGVGLAEQRYATACETAAKLRDELEQAHLAQKSHTECHARGIDANTRELVSMNEAEITRLRAELAEARSQEGVCRAFEALLSELNICGPWLSVMEARRAMTKAGAREESGT